MKYWRCWTHQVRWSTDGERVGCWLEDGTCEVIPETTAIVREYAHYAGHSDPPPPRRTAV
jgi:hypothetical protein